jgi:GT2 family glycosyltransferase
MSAYRMDGWISDSVTPVPQPAGACLMVRRSALDGRLFDERFPLFFNDVDLCRRLQQRGAIYYLPSVRVRHQPGDGGINRTPETALLEYATSAVRYFRKYRSLPAAALLYVAASLDYSYKIGLALLAGLHRGPGARLPLHGRPGQNLARLARFLFDISYFERHQEARSPWRRLLLRALEADLWSG